MTEKANSDYLQEPEGSQATLKESKSVSFGGVTDLCKTAPEEVEVEPEKEQAVVLTGSDQPLGGDEEFMGGESARKEEDLAWLDEDGDEEEQKAGDDAAAAQSESEYEEVEVEEEEEGEEEMDDMDEPNELNEDGESPPKKKKMKKKVKRIVRRKKKKNLLLLIEPKNLNKESQMPEWTDALEIEYMNRDELNRVIERLRKEGGLSESDTKLAEDLHYRRATFQMDHYVKLTEVRGIVKEALHSILDRMSHADGIAKRNRTEISIMDSKLKNQAAAVKHLSRLENGQNSLIRLQKDQQSKLAEYGQALTDIKYEVAQTREERKVKDQDFEVSIQTINNKQTLIEIQMADQMERMFSAKEQLDGFQEWSKQNFDEQMKDLERKVQQLPAKIDQEVLLVEKMKREIERKAADQFHVICTSLKLDTVRLTDIEIQMQTLHEINKKTDTINVEVKKLRHLEDDLFQVNCFIERILPIQIHHQICEGLNHVSGADLDDLMKFEIEKSDELYKFSKSCEGIKPSLKRLRQAMDKFHKHILKLNLGSAPFTYGDAKDYWPEMPERYMDQYNKQKYLKERNKPILSKLADADRERQNRLEDHITFLMQGERDATKLLIHREVTDLKDSIAAQNMAQRQNYGGGGGGGSRNRAGKESSRGSQHSIMLNQQQNQQPQSQSQWFPNQQPGNDSINQINAQQSSITGGGDGGHKRGGGRSMGSKGRRTLKQSNVQSPNGSAFPSQINVADNAGVASPTTMSPTNRMSPTNQQELHLQRPTHSNPPHQQQSQQQQQQPSQQRVSPNVQRLSTQDRVNAPPHIDIISQSNVASSFGFASNNNKLDDDRQESQEESSSRHNDSSYRSHSQYYQEQKTQIIYETRIINNNRVINKFDKEMLFQLKKKMRAFMEQGRTEFHTQFLKWQVLFNETSEDAYEAESRIIRLESIAGLLTTQIETLQEELQDANYKVQLQQEQVNDHEKYLVECEEELDLDEAKITVESSIQLSGGTSRSDRKEQQQQSNKVLNKEGPTGLEGTKKQKSFDVPKVVLSPKMKGSTNDDKDNSAAGKMFVRMKTSIRDIVATRQKKVDQQFQELVAAKEASAAPKNVLEPIHESLDENDERFGRRANQAVASNRSRQSSQTSSNKLNSTRKTQSTTPVPRVKVEALLLNPASAAAQQQKKGTAATRKCSPIQQASQPPSRQMRLNKLQNATTNVNSIGKAPQLQKQQSVESAKSQSREVIQKQKDIITQGMRRISKDKKLSAVSSTTSDDTVSSLNTVEKTDNVEAEQKMAGMSFNFASEMQRKTMNRTELAQLIQEKFNEVAQKTELYTNSIHSKMDMILIKEEDMRKQIILYQDETRTYIREFIDIQVTELKEKGFEMQNKLFKRIEGSEKAVKEFSSRLEINEREIKIMNDRMQQEYTDFLQARKRWKSDFQSADSKNKEHIERVHGMIGGCENQNEVNTRAIKMMLDAQMIEQLVQRQEVADRKQLLVMAMKDHKELMSTDGGVVAREISGPNVDLSKLKNDRSKNQNQSGSVDTRAVNEKFTHDFHDFDQNASRIDPPMLRVDRNCLNCSDNKTSTLNAIKIACLGYTQSPIPYQGKNYHVSHLLTVKAQVVAQCQRMLRENLFQTKEHAGVDIRAEDNERSFVITPLLNVNPVKVETNLQEFLKSFGHQQAEANAMGSLALEQNSQTGNQDGKQHSLAESSIQQIREQRYPTQLTPKAALQNSYGNEKIILGVEGNVEKPKTKPRNFQQDFIQSKQQQVSTEEDIFSNDQNQDSTSIFVPTQKKSGVLNRGQSQLAQYKKKEINILNSSGQKSQFAHIRFASTSKIDNGRNEWQDVRRSMQNVDTGALPDLKKQRGVFPQRGPNADFEYMFEISGNASTKHSHVRQSSVLTGATNKNILSSTRYKHAGGNHSALDEAVYRATDGFRQTQTPTSHIVVKQQVNNRPQTQGDMLAGVRRINYNK